jgi:hypothetical protein
MELNIQKTKIISFTRETNCAHVSYYVNNVTILRSDCIKALGVMLSSKLYFHCHVVFVHSQALATLGLTPYITYYVSPLDYLVVLHNALIRSKLE